MPEKSRIVWPLLVVAVPALAMISMGEKLLGFLDPMAFSITIGGTLAVSSCSFSRMEIREAGRVLGDLFAAHSANRGEQLEELKRLAHLHRIGGPRALESREHTISDPFMRLGIAMVADLVKPDEIDERLQIEARALLSRQESARQVLLTIGKLLPAFGLIGTLIGLVLVLREISGQGSPLTTSALSTAVLTTLYGAVFANVLVFPLAARLQSAALSREAVIRLTIDGVLLIAHGESPATIDRKLRPAAPPAKNGSANAWAAEWLLSRRSSP